MVKFEINAQIFKDLINNAGLATDQKADRGNEMYRGILFKVIDEHKFNLISTTGDWISVQQYFTADEFPLEVGFEALLDYYPLSLSLKSVAGILQLSVEITEESLTWNYADQTARVRHIEDKYRDYKPIFKLPESTGNKVTFNSKLVTQILKTKVPGRASKDTWPNVDMVIESEFKPMRFHSQSPGWQWYAMAMPMRLSGHVISLDTEMPFEV